MLPSSSNVIMAAERACELSEKPARVVAGDLPAGEPAGPGRARPGRLGARRTPSGSARRSGGGRHRRRRPGRPRRRPGALPQGDAVGFADGEIVAWGGAGSTLATTIEHLAEGAEIVTVIAGEERPDPARGDRHPRPRRGRDRDPRGRPAELVVAARGPVVRSLRAAPRELSRRATLLARPRPLAAARASLDASLQSLDGVGPKLAEAAAEAGIAPSATCCCRFPHSHRDRTERAARRPRAGRQATVLVEVLGTAAAPVPPARPHDRRASKSATAAGHVRATWFNQPWLADKLDARAPACCSPASATDAASASSSTRSSAERGLRAPAAACHDAAGSVPVHPATEALTAAADPRVG